MRSFIYSRVLAIALSVAALAAGAQAHENWVGVRAGAYTEMGDGFVGAEFLTPVGRQIFLNPNFEYVFRQDHTFMTFSGDFHYDIRTHGPAYLWVGGGLAIIYDSPPAPFRSTTDPGADILAGVGLKGRVIPYVQAKVIATRNSQFVLGFGLRF